MCDGDTHTPTHAHTLAMIHTHTYTYKRTLPHSICGLIWLSVAHDADKKKREPEQRMTASAHNCPIHTHTYTCVHMVAWAFCFRLFLHFHLLHEKLAGHCARARWGLLAVVIMARQIGRRKWYESNGSAGSSKSCDIKKRQLKVRAAWRQRRVDS